MMVSLSGLPMEHKPWDFNPRIREGYDALKEFLITYEGEDIEKCLENMEEPK